MQDIREIPIGEIYQAKSNIRRASNEKNLQELVQSVKSKGILQPIIVRVGKSRGESAYEIVCGHRRVLAATEAGLKVVPAIVRELSDDEAAEINVIENLQREDVNAMDEAVGIAALMKTGKNDARAIASKLGKSESYIAGRMKLLKLPAEVQKAISSGEISPAHGMVVARLTDPEKQKHLLESIKEEKLSVSRAENELEEYGKCIADFIFDKKDCSGCANNGTKIKDFFDKDTDLKGQCLDAQCALKKTKEWIEKIGSVLLDEAQAEKRFGQAWQNKGQKIYDSYKRDLGKKYKACAKCEVHCFIQDEYSDIGEYCFDPRCLHGTKKVGETEGITEQSEQRAETKAHNRCFSTMQAVWRDFILEKLDEHTIKVLICKQIWDAVNGCDMDESDIAKLWKKSDVELTKRTLDGLTDLIQNQYVIEDLSEISAGLKFDPVKHVTLDDTYFGACSKSDLLALAKKLGVKDLTESDKRADMITKVKSAVKPGFVPEDIKKYIKEL